MGNAWLAVAQGGILDLLLPMVFVFGIFYFLLIRPQNKQRKEREVMLKRIAKGDRVITNGGLFGKVAAVNDGVITLEIADRVKVKVLLGQVAGFEDQMMAMSVGKEDKKDEKEGGESAREEETQKG